MLLVAFVLLVSVRIEQVISIQVLDCPRGKYSKNANCYNCTAGKYAVPPYATNCNECTPGKFQNVPGSDTCNKCAVGFYSNYGSSSCNNCPIGYFQNDRGKRVCKKCKSGQITAITASETCTHCPSGKYQNETAQWFCRGCPWGWQQITRGSASCTECRAGTYGSRDDGLPTCLNCKLGQYQNEIAQQNCTECPSGFANDMEQSSFCRKCPQNVNSTEPFCRGWGLDSSSEYIACPQGKYSDGLSTTTCVDCPIGRVSVKDKATEGYDSCRRCVGGTGPNENQTSCVDCPTGTYGGLDGCSRCALGRFSNSVGANACSNCMAGTYSNGTIFINGIERNVTMDSCYSCPNGWSTNGIEGADKCVACANNLKSHVKQSSCTQNCPSLISKPIVNDVSKCDTCGVGQQYNPNGKCENCSFGFYKDVSMPNCSKCPEWSVSSTDFGTCELCDEGSIPKSEGSVPKSNNCEVCGAGQYQKYQLEQGNKISLICEDCPLGFMQSSTGTTNCSACDAGQYQNQEGQSSCTNCSSGTYQSMTSEIECLSCPNGYVSTAPGSDKCTMCPNGKGTKPTHTSCQSCTSGQGSFAGICEDCPPGKRSNANVCELCRYNEYQDAYGKSFCKSCVNRVSAPGATACGPCAAAKYLLDGTCVSCKSGEYRGVDDPEDRCIPVNAPCPHGMKASTGADGTCESCPDGKQSDQGTCTNCTAGFFEKDSVCESCPVGYYQAQDGQVSCTMCGTFKFASIGSRDCKNCDETYNIVVNGICDVCPQGKMYDMNAATSHLIEDCKSCPAGEEVASKTTCKPCTKNEFSEQGEYCQLCPTGFATQSTGSSSCIKCVDGDCNGVCPEGEYLSEGICKNCPSGYVSLGGYQNKCSECTKGTYQHQQSKSNCILCEPGQYSLVGANNLCHTCAKGQYQDGKGQSACIDCMPGKYNQNTGQTECNECPLGKFTENFGTDNLGNCMVCPAGKRGHSVLSGTCEDCEEGTWQNETGQLKCNDCPDDSIVPYSAAGSTAAEDCFDIHNIKSYVFGMKDDSKVSQTFDTSCEIRPNMVLYCPSCTCKSDVRDGYWAGPVCDECQRGFAGGQVGKCLIKCPGYDGVHDSTMCNGNGKCWYGKHGSGECLCGGKNILDSTSNNVVVSVKTCPAGQICPGYGTDISDTDQYKPVYYQMEYRQYSVFVLQKNSHTPQRGHMWFERYSPQNIYENVCSACVGTYDGSTSTQIGYFNSQNNYATFQHELQLENGFHGENCQYECAACLNNGKCLNTPHSFYYNYGIESVLTVPPIQVFLPQTQCICSSSIYDGDAMCCPHGFEPYVYFGKRGVTPSFQYTALPFITNIVNRQTSYWTDEDLWLNTQYTPSYKESNNNKIYVSNINKIYSDSSDQHVLQTYDITGPYTKHTFYGTEKDICRACPGLFGKGVRSRSNLLNTASQAEDFWWDSAAAGQKCNGKGVCDFYSQKIQQKVLFMGEYRTDNGNKFQRHRNHTSCQDIVNADTIGDNIVTLSVCINNTMAAGATAFVYSESYKFIWDAQKMPKSTENTNTFDPPTQYHPKMNKHGYISTIVNNIRTYWIVESETYVNYMPIPNPNGEYTFHPWNEGDCKIVTNTCVMTVKEDYSLYKVGQTGHGDERLDGASFDRFDTCLTYDDGSFKTTIGNYVTKTYENGQDPFLGGHCPRGHLCTATGYGTDTVGYKEACPPGYFQPDEGQTRTGPDIHCSQMDTNHVNCTENLATKVTDYVDKKCQRCQPNEYAPEGSSACTACPVGRVKKLSGNIPMSVLQTMYNIPISLDDVWWYYIDDETGFEMSDCALVPNGIVHVPEADQYMTAAIPQFLPVFPCPFAYSSRPGTYVIDGHDLVTRLLQTKQEVIVEPYANVITSRGTNYEEVKKGFAKDHCFFCPSSSITGHGSTTCTTCFQDRTAFSAKEIIKSVVEHTPSKFLPEDENLTSYDHWTTNHAFDKVPIVDQTVVRSFVSGKTVNTEKEVSIAEIMGYCNYHYPTYVGVLINNETNNLSADSADKYKHTCVASIVDCGTDCEINIHMKVDGNWTTQYPLCMGCESGKSNTAEVVGQCVDCTEGKFTSTMEEASKTYCEPCPAGRYTDQDGSLQCTNCPEGYSQDVTGEDKCKRCVAGYYQDQERQEICNECQSGTYITIEGSTEPCLTCLQGQRWFSTTESCKDCHNLHYMDELANKNTHCKPCEAGKRWESLTAPCTSCTEGRIGSDPGNAVCTACGPGEYTDEPAQTVCKLCLAGQYQGETGISSCKPCAKNTFASSDGSTSCEQTAKGYEALEEGLTTQTPCTRNRYNDEIGGKCKTCRQGRSTPKDDAAESCWPCQTGRASPGGGSDCAWCEAGKFAGEGWAKCQFCPKGFSTSYVRSEKCRIPCKTGQIVNHEAPKGTCNVCRYTGGDTSERACYCALPIGRCEVKAVKAIVNLFSPKVSLKDKVMGVLGIFGIRL